MMQNSTQILIIYVITCMVVCSLLLLILSSLTKTSNSFRQAIVAAILIVTLTITPLYLYYRIPSQHAHLDTNNLMIFGVISFKLIIIMLIALGIYSLTCVILHLVYKISLELSAYLSVLFYCLIGLLITLLLICYPEFFFQQIETLLTQLKLT